MHTTNFYIELALVILAISGRACTYAAGAQSNQAQGFAVSPTKFVSAEFITRPLFAVGPVIYITLLWLAQIIAISFDIGGGFTDGIIRLTYSYLLIACVMS